MLAAMRGEMCVGVWETHTVEAQAATIGRNRRNIRSGRLPRREPSGERVGPPAEIRRGDAAGEDDAREDGSRGVGNMFMTSGSVDDPRLPRRPERPFFPTDGTRVRGPH